jgi:hypothetical protein
VVGVSSGGGSVYVHPANGVSLVRDSGLITA